MCCSASLHDVVWLKAGFELLCSGSLLVRADLAPLPVSPVWHACQLCCRLHETQSMLCLSEQLRGSGITLNTFEKPARANLIIQFPSILTPLRLLQIPSHPS